MGTVSIITPFKNVEKHIESTCKSILKQSFRNWEWILVNDHSEQKEILVLEKYLNKHPIKIVENEGNGIIDALVTASKYCKGEYITRMDADDIMPEDKLEVLVSTLNDTGADVATGKVMYFSDLPVSEGYQKYEDWLNEIAAQQDFYSQIYRECTVASGNWLMRRSTFNAIGGFDGLIYPEDYDFLFRWYQKGLRIVAHQKVTHLWREHSERTSRNSEHYSQEYFFNLKIKRFIDFDGDKNAQLVLNGAAKKAKLTAKRLIIMKIPFLWVTHKPENFKAGIYGHEIMHYKKVQGFQILQVLNAVMVDNNELKKIFLKHNQKVEVFLL